MKIQKGKPSERGMVTLSAIMIFMIVAGLLIASAVSRNIALSRDLHRSLFDKQAEWLAESAIVRAMAKIVTAQEPLSIAPQTYSERIAPVYVSEDPLVGEEENSAATIITVQYGFQISAAGKELLTPDMEKAFIIQARSDIPYRNVLLSKAISRLFFFSSKEGWKSQPLIPAGQF